MLDRAMEADGWTVVPLAGLLRAWCGQEVLSSFLGRIESLRQTPPAENDRLDGRRASRWSVTTRPSPAAAACDALAATITTLPRELHRTLNWDQDSEMISTPQLKIESGVDRTTRRPVATVTEWAVRL